MLTKTDLARMVQDFYHSALNDENEIRLSSRVTFDEANRLAIIDHYEAMGRTAKRNLATNNLSAVEQAATDLIEKHGLSGQLSDRDVASVQQAILRVANDFCDAMKVRFEGNYSYQPRDDLLVMDLAADVVLPTAAAAPVATLKPESEEIALNDSMLFSERAEKFRNQQVRRQIWENQTALQARKTFQLFIEACAVARTRCAGSGHAGNCPSRYDKGGHPA